MRFLGVGEAADLAALYLRLMDEGHDVRLFVENPSCKDTLSGLVERVDNWKNELSWIRSAGGEGCLLFENVGRGWGKIQDDLRNEGFNVIGSSAYGEKLENDREFAQNVLRELEFSTLPVATFIDSAAAIRFIAENPARYVLKANGSSASTYLGRHPGGNDISALLAADVMASASSFVLTPHVEGVEMGVGVYFNGEDFILPACLDWEHKHFFEGDQGELTGEMGTVVTYQGTGRFFSRTLAKMKPLLAKTGYVGYVNLNTIVNEHGIWPLEFTCRFGYPGYAILEPLQRTSWSDLFKRMITRSDIRLDVESGFCAGLVITTPPFPYSREKVPEPIGLPILFGEISDADQRHLHYGEVALRDGVLVTAGAFGYTMVVTGVGAGIDEANSNANALARKVLVTNARYRRDIGSRLIAGDYARVESLGLLGD